jgi:hypothetical protein
MELGYRLRRAAWNRGYATEGPDPIEGHEHGEVDYALTRSGWQARQEGVR